MPAPIVAPLASADAADDKLRSVLDWGLGYMDKLISEASVGGHQPFIFRNGLGNTMTPLCVRDEYFGPWWSQKDTPIVRLDVP